MERRSMQERAHWREKVEEQGLIFHTIDGEPYWDETACYAFTAEEVDVVEAAANELQALCLDAVEHVIAENRFEELGIPAPAIPLIKASWEQNHPSMYGRFDLAYDGQSAPKLLEYNADTPTALLEASVIQWHWLEEVFPRGDQFNSIHERLIAEWSVLKETVFFDSPVHFASMEDVEDEITVTYLMDTAHQAGLKTRRILMPEIGWDREQRQFVDLENTSIIALFKLYPWEWILTDEFAEQMRESFARMIWMEPAWKMILSNKGILPILWECNPGHPNLLEAYADEPHGLQQYVKKPFLGREGANVTLKTRGNTVETDGAYAQGRFVYQAAAAMPNFRGNYPVIGAWVIGGEAGGMGIRESDTPITDNRSRFVPHAFF